MSSQASLDHWRVAPLLQTIWSRRFLLRQLIRTDLAARFTGSFAGFGWMIIHPLLLMVVYTIVFGFIYKANVPGLRGTSGPLDFAVFLFAGLIVFTFFAEVVSRAPVAVVANANYVKRVVFPLELLTISIIGVGIVQLAVGLALAAGLVVALYGVVSWKILLVPAVVAITIPWLLGTAWILAALGAYMRDVQHIVGVAMNFVMFLSPVFYPAAMLPEQVRWALFLNPITYPIEAVRGILLHEAVPAPAGFMVYLGIGLIAAWCGAAFFRKVKPGFADVI